MDKYKDDFNDKAMHVCLKYPSRPMTFEERDEIQVKIEEEQSNDII